MRNHQVDIKSEPITKEVLKKMDLVLIATDHSQYDYEFIGKHAQIIVDTRNCMAKENPALLTFGKHEVKDYASANLYLNT